MPSKNPKIQAALKSGQISKKQYDKLPEALLLGIVKKGDAKGGVKEKRKKIGKAKGKASGGPVQGMNPYMVGEKGPELFIPAMGGNIIPNDRLAGGTADRVYGDTSKMDAKFDAMIGLLSQANTDRVSGTRKLGGQFEDGMGQR